MVSKGSDKTLGLEAGELHGLNELSSQDERLLLLPLPCLSARRQESTAQKHPSEHNHCVVNKMSCLNNFGSLVPLKLKMFSPSEFGELVFRTISDGDMQDTGEDSRDGGMFR